MKLRPFALLGRLALLPALIAALLAPPAYAERVQVDVPQATTDGGVPVKPVRGATYSVTLAASLSAAPSGVVLQLQGSSTKTIKITRIRAQGITGGTTGIATVNIAKNSATATGGVTSPTTVAKFDSANAAATAAVLSWTTPATAGTQTALIESNYIQIPLTGALPTVMDRYFGENDRAQELTLRGAAEFMTVTIAAIGTPTASVYVEWIEE